MHKHCGNGDGDGKRSLFGKVTDEKRHPVEKDRGQSVELTEDNVVYGRMLAYRLLGLALRE